jgi:quinol monooxygenase YgiN
MSPRSTNRPEYEQVVDTFRAALPDSLSHDVCEAIHPRRDQDAPLASSRSPQWASRRHYEDYLAWSTATGLTDEIGGLLTGPIPIEYFDDIVTVTWQI